MSHKEPTKEELRPFNLHPYQYRILHLLKSRSGVHEDEVVKDHGSWWDLFLRGLVHRHQSTLYPTAQGLAFVAAIGALRCIDF
jgi:hypothetical protein